MNFKIYRPWGVNIYTLMRKVGYYFRKRNAEKAELEFVRPARGYPRFHLFIKIKNDNFIFSLHLDQKRPIYKDASAHAGEYQGITVKKEAERIKENIKNLQ